MQVFDFIGLYIDFKHQMYIMLNKQLAASILIKLHHAVKLFFNYRLKLIVCPIWTRCDMFNFIHYSGFNGNVSISAKNAAKIMNVTDKTIKKYLAFPDKADPCKMAHLEAVACRRVLPKNWPVWVDGDTMYTNSGYSFNKSEIESIGWLRSTYANQINEVKRLKKEITALKAELNDQAQKKAVLNLPHNVVVFKPR